MLENVQNRTSETTQSIIESAKNYTSEISDKVRNATQSATVYKDKLIDEFQQWVHDNYDNSTHQDKKALLKEWVNEVFALDYDEQS